MRYVWYIFFRAADVQVAFKNSLSKAASGVSPTEVSLSRTV